MSIFNLSTCIKISCSDLCLTFYTNTQLFAFDIVHQVKSSGYHTYRLPRWLKCVPGMASWRALVLKYLL